MRRHSLIRLTALLLTALLSIAAHADSVLKFEDVWIAEAPPVSKVLAAYMTINNTGDKDQKIVSATSDDFGSIEFHRTVDKDGMASMQHQEHLIVPAKGTLILKPGDYHMMLFRPVRKLSAGDKSTFHFQLDDGTPINATAVVRKASAENSHEHHHH